MELILLVFVVSLVGALISLLVFMFSLMPASPPLADTTPKILESISMLHDSIRINRQYSVKIQEYAESIDLRLKALESKHGSLE